MRSAAGAPSPFSRSGRPCYWLRGQLKGAPPTFGHSVDRSSRLGGCESRSELPGVRLVGRFASACLCVRESVWKWRRWNTKKGKQHLLRQAGLAVIFGRHDFRGRVLEMCANKYAWIFVSRKNRNFDDFE